MVTVAQLQDIPPENMILLVGPPGAGKPEFCQQTILQRLAMDKPIIYVTTECSPSKAEVHLKEGGLGEIEQGLLHYIDAYNETVGLSVPDRPDTVYADCSNLSSIGIAISKLQERIREKGILMVFDSLVSPYLLSGPEVLRFLRLTLSRFAAEGNSILMCMDTGSAKQEDLSTMMSLSNGVINIETEDGKKVLNVMKHPKARPTRIEVPSAEIPERIYDVKAWEDMLSLVLEWMRGGAFPLLRREVGDYVNLFWTNFAHWSGMLWDPKRFPEMTYELGKNHGDSMKEMMTVAPWHQKLLFKLFIPKSFSEVKDMKKMAKFFKQSKQARTGILEYLEGDSKTDEHYIRVHESFECCGFENVGAPMASLTPPTIAGMCKSFESWRGLERDWNAVETKCIGLGDSYCEFKMVPGEISELKDSLEKDSAVLERIHEQLMNRLMGFLLEGKPLAERLRLGGDVYMSMGGRGYMTLFSERYRMAMRMGGAKAGKEVGVRLTDAGLSADEAAKRILHFLEHCKVGKPSMVETIRMRESCEGVWWTMTKKKREEPSCFFITGFLNGFFSAVKNQHVKEIKCIAMGDPYCEWEFR
jgi:predicted hydrocarbon binding protein/KaiC/GvpD/RAD55 family RecA-like ATPase